MRYLDILCSSRQMLVAAMLVTAVVPCLADEASDKAVIQHVMRGTWDKPDAPLRIEPIVVASGYAVAGWAQGDMGGRALLRRKGDAWSIVLCSGDALKSADTLIKAAVPITAAAELAAGLAKAEASTDPRLVAQFSRFEGLVMMDEAGNHPPHHK